MKNKFTKGEWRREGRTVFIPVYNDKAGCETVNMILEKEEGEAEANAKLIAAAPAMYQACIAAITALDLHDKFGNDIDARHAAEEDAFYLLKQAIKATEQ